MLQRGSVRRSFWGLLVIVAQHAAPAAAAPVHGIQREIAAPTNLVPGVPAAVPFDVTSVNKGGFPAPAGTIGVAQRPGMHRIAGNVTLPFTGSTAADVTGTVNVNGSSISTFVATLSPNSLTQVPFTTLAALVPGDVVTVEMASSASGVSISHLYSHGSLTSNRADDGLQARWANDVEFSPPGVEQRISPTVLEYNFNYPGFVARGGPIRVDGVFNVRNDGSAGQDFSGAVLEFFENPIGSALTNLRTGSNQIAYSFVGQPSDGDSIYTVMFTDQTGATLIGDLSHLAVVDESDALMVTRAPIALSSNALPADVEWTVPYAPVGTGYNVGGFTTPNNAVAEAVRSGLYTIGGSFRFDYDGADAGVARVTVLVNGVESASFSSSLNPRGLTEIPFTTLADLNGGDLVSINLFTDVDGVSLNTGARVYMMTSAVPEPTTTVAAILGMSAVLSWRRRNRRLRSDQLGTSGRSDAIELYAA